MAPPEFIHVPETWQTSIGIQQQFGSVTAVTADYVYSKGSHEKDVVDNVNLTFNPATGANYPSTDRTRRLDPNWGTVSMNSHMARSAYHAVQTSVTKRLSNRWQASANYTLAWLYNADSRPFTGERDASGNITLFQVPFDTQPDLGGEWSLSGDDQRHRFVFNGIWEVGWGFQVSGLHYMGAGLRLATNYGGDLRSFGGGSGRLRPDGTIVPRNTEMSPAQNRTNIGLRQRIPVPGGWHSTRSPRCSIYSTGPTTHSAPRRASRRTICNPCRGRYRTAQFGFRVTF